MQEKFGKKYLFNYLFTYLLTYLLTPRSRVLHEKLTGFQLVKKLRAYYRTRRFITHLQVPATCPYPEPARSCPYPTPYFLNIHLNIILPSTSESIKWSLSLRFPHQNPVYASPLTHSLYMPHPFSLLDLIIRTILSEEYRSFSSSLCSLLHSPATVPLRPKYSPQHSISNTLSLRSSLNVSDQVPHPYNTRCKIIFLYFLIFKFFSSQLEDKRFCTE